MKLNREPAAWTALVVAATDVAVAVGVPVSDGLKAAILALVTAAAGVLVRSQVTPNASLRRVVYQRTIPLTKEEQVAKARPADYHSPGVIPPGPVQVTKAKPVEHAAKAKKAAAKKKP